MDPTTYDTPGPLRLDVNIPSGEVLVVAESTGSTTLQITGERDPDDVSVVFEPEGDGHRLTVEQRKRKLFSSFGSQDLKVKVSVPSDTHVTVRSGSADLLSRGSIGSLVFKSGSGDASVETVKGNAEAKVASGDMRIDRVDGKLSFHGASGDLRATIVNGDATARTASGDVKLGTVAGHAKVTTVSGDIDISRVLGGGRTSLQAISGDIEVGVEGGASLHLDLSSTSGSTKSDLDVSDDPATTHDHQREIDVKAATVSGDVTVRRAR